MFKKKLHPLPEFPKGVTSTFKKLCTVVPAEFIPQMEQEIMEMTKEFLNSDNPSYIKERKTIEALKDRSLKLLKRYPELPPSIQQKVIGAIRYFLNTNDALPISDFASGLSDDVRVMNHVLEEAKIEDYI